MQNGGHYAYNTFDIIRIITAVIRMTKVAIICIYNATIAIKSETRFWDTFFVFKMTDKNRILRWIEVTPKHNQRNRTKEQNEN